MLSVSSYIPKHLLPRYRIFRWLLWISLFLLAGSFIFHTLFPTIETRFDFKAPQSSKNTIREPRTPTDEPRINGKIETGGILIANTSVLGNFSSFSVATQLENKSDVPESLSFSVRRSYQSFLLPTGPALTAPNTETLYVVNDIYYALRDNKLYPFVSEAAYRSRFPQSFAVLETDTLLQRYPVAEEYIGYRVGSLIAFADGVFIVTDEKEIRPIGSADIFLALGYHFEDVLPANEEELGIYHRGKIFLIDDMHPSGTLLLDQDTKTYYIIDHSFKRPVSGPALDFFLERQTPVLVSSRTSQETALCDLHPSIFGKTLSCTAESDRLDSGFGNDFEITLSGNNVAIDINTLTLSFKTTVNDRNMFTLLSQVKQRLLSRFGYGNE